MQCRDIQQPSCQTCNQMVQNGIACTYNKGQNRCVEKGAFSSSSCVPCEPDPGCSSCEHVDTPGAKCPVCRVGYYKDGDGNCALRHPAPGDGSCKSIAEPSCETCNQHYDMVDHIGLDCVYSEGRCVSIVNAANKRRSVDQTCAWSDDLQKFVDLDSHSLPHVTYQDAQCLQRIYLAYSRTLCRNPNMGVGMSWWMQQCRLNTHKAQSLASIERAMKWSDEYEASRQAEPPKLRDNRAEACPDHKWGNKWENRNPGDQKPCKEMEVTCLDYSA